MKQLSYWTQNNLFSGTLSLNLAAKLLAQENFIEIVQENLNSYNIDAKRIEFELIESDIMAKPEEAIKKLNSLHDLGVKISVDDFGTGYSSLSYLKRFPIDKLKIDQSFVRDLPEDEEDCSIVNAIIALGESLSLTLLAEGVEEESQKLFLVENGCDNIQGYLYSKPLPADEFEDFIKTFK
ncbi:MAG: EAL domain-containing protein [Sulfurimonas sp.]|nr:EAL domain-containing protein [Sulfurimonas sp.]